VAATAATARVAGGPRVASLSAVLEAVDASSVRATAATAGVVRHSAARGSAIAAGASLVELRRSSPTAARKLAELNALIDEYEDSREHADEIARARSEYREAARAAIGSAVRAPRAGVLVASLVRPGDTVEAGDEVARVASAVRLIVGAGDVEGAGAACSVALLERPGLVLDGQLVPGVPEARSRTIALSSFPSDLPLGSIGRVKATCR
jgi:predicted deacylase